MAKSAVLKVAAEPSGPPILRVLKGDGEQKKHWRWSTARNNIHLVGPEPIPEPSPVVRKAKRKRAKKRTFPYVMKGSGLHRPARTVPVVFSDVVTGLTVAALEEADRTGKCPLCLTLRAVTGLPWIEAWRKRKHDGRFYMVVRSRYYGKRLELQVPEHIEELIIRFWKQRYDEVPAEIILTYHAHDYRIKIKQCPVRVRMT